MKSEVDLAMQGAPITREPACLACGSRRLEAFFAIPELPVNCIALGMTRAAALNCPKGRIELGFCCQCGAVSNIAFDATRLSYDPSYDNSLHFSPTFHKYADAVARRLVEQYDLRGKTIVDVGCGNAEFLSLICGLGNNRGVGFDPTFVAGRASLDVGRGVGIIRDYYSERYAKYSADFLICRHVLEHISKPRPFLHMVRRAVAGNSGAAIFFEVPNASFVFQNKGIWDIIYEHCFYYSASALATLFSACGFDVLNVSHTFDGQYLCLEARVSCEEIGLLATEGGDLESMRDEILKFAEEYRSCRAYWEDTLRRFARQGKRLALWGAGAKGAMFLNAFGNASPPECVVDVNPHKHGLYIPGTGQQVMGPEFLKAYRPDVVLIANSSYRDEISREVSTLGINPDLLPI